MERRQGRSTVTQTQFCIKSFLIETSSKPLSTSRKRGKLRYFKARNFSVQSVSLKHWFNLLNLQLLLLVLFIYLFSSTFLLTLLYLFRSYRNKRILPILIQPCCIFYYRSLIQLQKLNGQGKMINRIEQAYCFISLYTDWSNAFNMWAKVRAHNHYRYYSVNEVSRLPLDLYQYVFSGFLPCIKISWFRRSSMQETV